MTNIQALDILQFIIKQFASKKSSLLLKIDLPKYTNITSKLKWILCTKLIKGPSKEASVG